MAGWGRGTPGFTAGTEQLGVCGHTPLHPWTQRGSGLGAPLGQARHPLATLARRWQRNQYNHVPPENPWSGTGGAWCHPRDIIMGNVTGKEFLVTEAVK